MRYQVTASGNSTMQWQIGGLSDPSITAAGTREAQDHCAPDAPCVANSLQPQGLRPTGNTDGHHTLRDLLLLEKKNAQKFSINHNFLNRCTTLHTIFRFWVWAFLHGPTLEAAGGPGRTELSVIWRSDCTIWGFSTLCKRKRKSERERKRK